MRRLFAITVAVVVLLVGCSLEPAQEPLETAIPAALVASDLGIIEAEASTNMDGFVTYLSVYVVLDRDTLTPDELVQIITLSVENTDADNIGALRVGARDINTDGFEFIDVGAVGSLLGFPRNSVIPDALYIGWDEAIALIDD